MSGQKVGRTREKPSVFDNVQSTNSCLDLLGNERRPRGWILDVVWERKRAALCAQHLEPRRAILSDHTKPCTCLSGARVNESGVRGLQVQRIG